MVLVCISLMANDVWGTNHGLYAKSILVIEKSIFNVAKCFFFFFLVFFWLVSHVMWDLSFLTRVQTRGPCIGSTVLTIGPPRKSHYKVF